MLKLELLLDTAALKIIRFFPYENSNALGLTLGQSKTILGINLAPFES